MHNLLNSNNSFTYHLPLMSLNLLFGKTFSLNEKLSKLLMEFASSSNDL